MNSPTSFPPKEPSSNPRPVAAAMLAAGFSRRMGVVHKLIQEVDGEPMLRQVARQLLASRCDRVVVVVGHQADAVRDVLSGLSVDVIPNPDFHEGMAASVRVAAGTARQGEALLICLGDMPYVSVQVIDAIIEAYRAGGHYENVAAFQPYFQGRAGNPVLWVPHAVRSLKALKGDEGARGLLKSLGNAVRQVPVPDDSIFLDIDTPEMLARVRAQQK